jgi:hypothetical protein
MSNKAKTEEHIKKIHLDVDLPHECQIDLMLLKQSPQMYY